MLLTAAAAALGTAPSLAAFNTASIGTTGGEFLQLAPSARATAMGEAYAAVADEASALYWNPAALTRIESRSLTLMHAPYLASSFFDYAAYGQNLGQYGAVGLGVQYFSAGSITQTENYVPVGSFTPYDLALSAGYGLTLGGFSVGAAGKYIQSHILNSAHTAAVDFGALSPACLDERLRLAVTLTNLGGTLKYEQDRESLPTALRLGGAYRIFKPWLASADVVFPRGDQPYAALGTEYVLASAKGLTFTGRAGYNSQTATAVTGLTGASFGAGFGFDKFCLDYAFVPFGGLGQAQRISLTYNFGLAEPAVAKPIPSITTEASPAAETPIPTITQTAPLSFEYISTNTEPSPAASAAISTAASTDKLDSLIKELKDDDHIVRAKAAIALGELGGSPAVEPLIQALQDEAGAVRGAAADALGKINDSRAVEPLIVLLQDPKPKVRALAVRALGRLGDNRALAPVQRLANDADPTVREKAGEAIKRLQQPNAVLDDLLR
jgi:hypothetical protein